MNRNLLIIVFFFTAILFSCKNNKDSKELQIVEKHAIEEHKTKEVDLKVVDFKGFKSYLEKKDGKVYVINFWATWCAPCVKELPHFEQLGETYAKDNVEVVLVSLDFPHVYEKKLKPFILDKKLKSEVIALDDVDANSWIPKVNKDWSGSIPATVIYKNDESKFFEKSFTYEELENEVKQFIN